MDEVQEVEVSVSSLREAGISARGLTLTGEQMREIQDLRGADFNETSMVGANLCGLDFAGASFVGADLSGSDLSGADLSDAHLDNASLSRANLIGANLYGESGGANLNAALLYNGSPSCQEEFKVTISAQQTLFSDRKKAIFTIAAALPEASPATSAKIPPRLTGIRLMNANLSEAHLEGADLRQLSLQSSIWTNARLQLACLVE